MINLDETIVSPENRDEKSSLALSTRQLQILNLIARGHTNTQIADQLNLSPHTIDAYCRRILLKFKTSSRVTAAVKASQLGLITHIGFNE